MPRLTNDYIRRMNDFQKLSYAEDHPAEAGRIARISAETAGICFCIQTRHTTGKVLNVVFGNKIPITE